MKSPASARVLVAGEDPRDVQQLVQQLQSHFDHVSGSTDADAAVAQFEAQAPDVIVMAFKRLEPAERYYLGLHRLCQSIYQRKHRTILLCRGEDTLAALDLCKKRVFDDYVQYWPNPPDGLRLVMSVWLASRELQAGQSDGPSGPELRLHAEQLEDLDRKLTQELEQGQKQAAAAHESLLDLERKLSSANDEFSQHLVASGADGAVEIKDSDALARQLKQFKRRQLEQTRQARDQGVEPMNAWAKDLKDKVAPALAGARALAAQVRQIKPVVLVVDDDDHMRSALRSALNNLGFSLVLVESGHQALRELAHLTPHVILLDIGLADINGIALTRQLKTMPQLLDTPVVLISGDARRETLISGMEAGAADFIAKPFTLEVLRGKLDKVLRQTQPE